MTITLELSLEEEQRLQQMAAQQGKKAEDIALEAVKRLLPSVQHTYTREEIEAVDNELFSHVVSAPEAVGADNESIDADLIAAYEGKPIPSVERRRTHVA